MKSPRGMNPAQAAADILEMMFIEKQEWATYAFILFVLFSATQIQLFIDRIREGRKKID